jgi:hypothetical protein
VRTEKPWTGDASGNVETPSGASAPRRIRWAQISASVGAALCIQLALVESYSRGEPFIHAAIALVVAAVAFRALEVWEGKR